jgi:hypothetical protein
VCAGDTLFFRARRSTVVSALPLAALALLVVWLLGAQEVLWPSVRGAAGRLSGPARGPRGTRGDRRGGDARRLRQESHAAPTAPANDSTARWQRYDPVMRRGPVLLTAMLILMAGCEGEEPTPTATPTVVPSPIGTELPVAVTGPVPELVPYMGVQKVVPPAGSDASIQEQVLWDVRYQTVRLTRLPGKTPVKCQGGRLKLDGGTSCTVTSGGLPVQWQVNVFDYGPSGEVMTARYSVKLTKAALSAKTLYGVFWESFHQTSDQLRCDEVRGSVVMTRAGPPFRCQYLESRKYRNPVWVDRPGLIGEDGWFDF